MKILQVIDTLQVGGAERVFIDMCNLLHENHYDVTALLLLEDAGVVASELLVPNIKLNRKNKWSLSTMYRCSQILRNYSIIHCHLRHVYAYISVVNMLFFCRSQIVFHDHYGSIGINSKVPFLFKSLLKPQYYIGVSSSLTSWALEKLKIKQENVFLLSNIIRKKKCTTSNTNQFDLILVSNIKPVKNNLFAVKIAKSFHKSLLLVGNVQDKDYCSLINNELDENSTIVTTITSAQEICKNATIGLHTSRSETGPLVLIEYLAQGLPFLAYETGEVAAILKPHFPEFFIDNFYIDQWKDRIDLITESKVDIEKMNTVFEKLFGEKQYYMKLIKIYKCISDY